MIKAIFFDLGDTVFHPDWRGRDKEVMKKTGVSVLWNKEMEKIHPDVSKGKRPLEDMFKLAMREQNRFVEMNFLVKVFRESYAKHSPIDFRMIGLVKKLRKKYNVFALSNTSKLRSSVDRKRGLFNNFDRVFLSCDIGMLKPDKRIYYYVLRKTGFKSKEVLFIDNDKKNIASAKKVGMNVILFRNDRDLFKRLNKLL